MSVDFEIIFACSFLIFCAVYFKNYLRAVYVALFKTTGPPTVPILGNVLLIADGKCLENISENVSQLYTPIMRVWVSIWPCFFISEPSHLQLILGNSRFTNKSLFYAALHNLIGPGLVSNSGDAWKINRKVIQPYFNINFLELFYETFSEGAKILTNNLKNGEVTITTPLNKLVLNILQEIVLGVPLADTANIKDSPFRGAPFAFIDRIMKPWLLFDTIFSSTNAAEAELKQKNKLLDYIRNILAQKKLETQRNISRNNTKPCLMDLFIEASQINPLFTEDSIVNETATFMLAGQDSVAAALAFSLYFIAKHQDVQEKIVSELEDIIGDDIMIKFEDIDKMKYLEQCVKEALRLCPTVPIISRRLQEDISFGDCILPEGTTVLMSAFATHRLPHIFPDPLKYNPDRFSAENLARMHPFAYMPFSIGPRNCIGNKFAMIEMKSVLAYILKKFHVSLRSETQELNFSYGISLRNKGGIWLKLKQR